jgi:hypothetical protein
MPTLTCRPDNVQAFAAPSQLLQIVSRTEFEHCRGQRSAALVGGRGDGEHGASSRRHPGPALLRHRLRLANLGVAISTLDVYASFPAARKDHVNVCAQEIRRSPSHGAWQQPATLFELFRCHSPTQTSYCAAASPAKKQTGKLPPISGHYAALTFLFRGLWPFLGPPRGNSSLPVRAGSLTDLLPRGRVVCPSAPLFKYTWAPRVSLTRL